MDNAKNREVILSRLKVFAHEPDTTIESQFIEIQAADPDVLYDGFHQALTGTGGIVHKVKDKDEAFEQLDTLLAEANVKTAILSEDNMIKTMGVKEFLSGKNMEIFPLEKDPGRHKDASFTADVGITGVDYALADTGTLVVLHNSDNARLLSLAPPIHVAFVERDMLLPDIETLVAKIKPGDRTMPSAMTLISGPSMSGDICMTMTYGMHGPKSLYVIFIG